MCLHMTIIHKFENTKVSEPSLRCSHLFYYKYKM